MFFSKEEFNKCQVEDTTYKGCLKCLAYKDCRNPYLPSQGLNEKNIYVLLPEPTKGDDVKDLNGKYFTRLKEVFKETVGVDLLKDCRISHALRCHINPKLVVKTPEGERPAKSEAEKKKIITQATNSAIYNCRGYVLDEIKKHKPKLIYAVGPTALQILFGDVWKGGISNNIEKFISYTIPHLELNAWVTPIYQSEFVSQKEDEFQPQVKTLWEKHIREGYTHLDKWVPDDDYYSQIELLYKEEDVKWLLERWLLDPVKFIAFDYETTGIKPYNKGHHISTMALCDGFKSYAFEKPKQKETLELLQRVLTHKQIGKIAHNIPFEDMWTYVDLNTQVKPWVLDTCLSTHLLDNRQGVSGLKFQTFVNFGVGDYSSHVEGYLKGQPVKELFNTNPVKWKKYTHGNSINKVDEMPLEDNLTYCALDALFTYKLAMNHIQRLRSVEMPRVSGKQYYGYDLYHRGALAYRKMSQNGFRIDRDLLAKQINKIERDKETIKAELIEQPFIQEWVKWKGKSFNLDSGEQLGCFLYEYKGITCKTFTDKGGYATDVEALEKLNIPELKTLIAYKKLDKVVGTYLKPFWFEANDDCILRPIFNLNTVISGRSSADSPSLQNIPKNNPQMKELIRSMLFPHKGQLLCEVDFSNLEVYIGCCYHKDQQMLTYLEDNTADMHRDLATVLWLTTRKDMTKDESIALWDKLGVKALRNATKGVLSFPIQYGSYYKEMAKDGWEQIPKFELKDGTPLKKHLESLGIFTYTDFENHVKTVEDWYWGDLFGSYGAWKKKHYKTYQKNGYMENKMGFKYSGYIKRNQAGNFPIQGSASNVLMYSIIKLQQWLEQGSMKSKIVGQIHDSIVLSLEPNEVWEVLDMARYIMTKMTKEQYPWIDVPLRAEADIGEVDGSWCTLKEMSWDDIRRKFG